MGWWLLAAIAASIIATQLIGFLWYGVFFAKPWMNAMGWEKLTKKQLEEKQKGAMPGYIASAVMAAVATALLWVMLVTWDILGQAMSDIPPALAAALFGLFVWAIGYLPGTYVAGFFEGGDRRIWAIGAGYWLVLIVLWAVFVGVFSTL